MIIHFLWFNGLLSSDGLFSAFCFVTFITRSIVGFILSESFYISLSWIMWLMKSLRSLLESGYLLPLFVFGFYLWLLFKDPLISGVDGPYYLIQVESILRGDGMVYGDPPLLFYLSSLSAYLFGDVRVGVSFTVALLSSLSVFPIYLLFRRLGDEYAAVVSSILLVFSPQLIRMAGDFMKNAVGIFFLTFSIYLVSRGLWDDDNRSLVSGFFVSMLTFMTHSLDFAFLLIFLFSYPILLLFFSDLRFRRWILFVSSLMVATVLLVLAFPNLFSDVGKGVSFLRDLLRFGVTAVSQNKFSPRLDGVLGPISFLNLSFVFLYLLAGSIVFFVRWRSMSSERFYLFWWRCSSVMLVCCPRSWI